LEDRDRARVVAALREVVPKVSFGGDLGEVMKGWLLATRTQSRRDGPATAALQDGGASSIERG
jgi:hypothetical protein